MSFYKTMKVAFKPFYKFYFNPTIINAEYLNVDGPLIIVCNHKHKLDPAASIISSDRVIRYMVKDKYYEKPILGNFFKWMGCINVSTKNKNFNAVSSAVEVLKNGGAIGIFPEGTRNKTEEKLLPFKKGAVTMAQLSGATIVPCAVSGSYKFRTGKLMFRYGKPFKVNKDDDLNVVNKKLRDTIEELLNENLKEN